MPVVSRPHVKDGQLMATVKTSTKLLSARMHYTTEPHLDSKGRKWITQSLTIDNNQLYGKAPPADATAWYVDVTDQRKAVVSSEVMIGSSD